jgi:putative FmdB family regulatory protein
MPVYDYDCAACGRRFEVIHGVHADPPTTCPLCGSGPVRKAFAAPAIHFKGSGWAKKERRAAAKSPTGGSKDGGDGSSSSGDADTPAKDAPAKDARPDGATPSSSSSTTNSDSKSGSTAGGD